MNPYEVLGVGQAANDGEIKGAFRRRARAAHPDHGGTDQEFARVKQAHLVLSDPARRAKFDKTGKVEDVNPDFQEQAALNEITAAISHVLMQEQEVADVKDAAMRLLNQKRQQLEAQAAPIKRALDRGTKVKSRFKRRSKGENVIARMLDWQIAQWAEITAKLDAQIDVLKRACEIIRDYDFDRMPETVMWAPSMTTTFAVFR